MTKINNLYMHLRFKCILLLTVAVAGNCFAQGSGDKPSQEKTRHIKTVTVALPGGFTGASGNAIPFDESFNLSGSAAGIERIELVYRVSPFQGNRDFWFKICPVDKKDMYLRTPFTGSESSVVFKEEDNQFYIKISSEARKPTNKELLPIGLKLKILKNAINPATKEVESADNEVSLNFDGYQLVTDKNVPWLEATKISPRYYFPSLADIGPNGYTRKPIAWEKNGDTFLLNIPPIHANVKYDFQFTVFTRPGLDDTATAKLIDEITSIVKKEYQIGTVNGRTSDDDLNFDKRVAATVSRSFNKGGTLVDADLNHYMLTHLSDPVKVLKSHILSAEARALQLKGIIESVKESLIDDQLPLLGTTFYTVGIVDEINDVSNTSLYTLQRQSNLIWTGNMDRTAIPLKKIGEYLSNATKLAKILAGTLKINSDGSEAVRASDLPDKQTIVYLYKFFQTLESDDFFVTKVSDGTPIRLFKGEGFYRFSTFFKQTLAALDTKNAKLVKSVVNPGVTKGLLNDPLSPIKAALEPIVKNLPKKISASTQDLLSLPLNPSIEGYKTIKVSDAALLAYNAFSNPTYFKNILEGTGAIDPSGKFVDLNLKDEVSLPSVKVLISLFRLINSPAFTDPDGKLLFAANKEALDFITFKLEVFASEVEGIQATKLDVESFQKEISSQIASSYIKKSYFISGSSIINMDVEAEKNPYIGLDFGMGYAFGPKSVFLNEGINIYFRPINRDASISSLYGWDRFLKTFSIFLGITQNLSDNATENGYQSLFNGSFNSSLLFGAGLRINTLMRLNAGGLIYRKTSPNPLVTKTDVSVSPTLSFAIDLTIAKLFTSIGELFK